MRYVYSPSHLPDSDQREQQPSAQQEMAQAPALAPAPALSQASDRPADHQQRQVQCEQEALRHEPEQIWGEREQIRSEEEQLQDAAPIPKLKEEALSQQKVNQFADQLVTEYE